MGNNWGKTKPNPEKPEEEQQDCSSPPQHEEPNFLSPCDRPRTIEDQDDHDHEITATTISSSSRLFMATPDLMGSRTPSDNRASGLDPKLKSLLEFFGQLYVRRKDIFKKIIPVHREDFEEMLNKIGFLQQEEDKQHTTKSRGIVSRQRSMSFGDAEDLKNYRFKVKPIDSGGGTPPTGDGSKGGGGGGGGGAGGKGGGGTKPK